MDNENSRHPTFFTILIFLSEIGLYWKVSVGNLPSIRQKSISSIFFSLENDTLDKIYLACNVLTVDNFLFPTQIAWNEIFLLLKTKLQMCKLWFMFLLFFISSFFYKIFGWETHFTTHYIKQSLQYLLNNISKMISNTVINDEYISTIFHKQ